MKKYTVCKNLFYPRSLIFFLLTPRNNGDMLKDPQTWGVSPLTSASRYLIISYFCLVRVGIRRLSLTVLLEHVVRNSLYTNCWRTRLAFPTTRYGRRPPPPHHPNESLGSHATTTVLHGSARGQASEPRMRNMVLHDLKAVSIRVVLYLLQGR